MNCYRKIISVFTAISCCFGLIDTTFADEIQSANLSVKYTPGKIYYTTHTSNRVLGKSPDTQMSDTAVKMKGVASKHEKGTSVSMAYEAITMKVREAGDLIAIYDSARDDNDPAIAKQLEPILQAQFAVVFSKKDKSVAFEGLDQLKLNPKAGITKETLESMMKLSPLMLPGREVKIGESWRAEIKLPMQGNGKMKMSFDGKLVSIDRIDGRSIAKIEYTGEITPLQTKQGGVEVKISSKTITSEIFFDLDLDQVVKMKMNMKLIMEVAGRKTSMTTVTTQELTKVEKAKR